MNIDVSATANADGSVTCKVTCDGQQATLTFTGTEVLFDVPEPQAATQ